MSTPRKKPVTEDKSVPLDTYGLGPGGRGQLDYDMAAFSSRRSVDFGVPPRHTLFRKIADKLLPNHFAWHDWTRRRIRTLTDNADQQSLLVALPGCAAAGKTFDVAGFAVCWWLAAPASSSVMFVSTTRDSLRKRGWAEIIACRNSMPGEKFGHLQDSKMMWQAEKGNAKNCIFGKAVEEGSTAKVADDIKGVHTQRQMVVIDEATAVPEAIWDACTNLYSYPKEFILVALANPRNRLERFARFMEPKDGWMSVSVDTEEWEGKPQPDYGGAVVKVLRCDAEKSPNIVEGRIVCEHLPTKEKVEAARTASGGGNSPYYWTNFRGFPPPEGLTKTVFTESVLITKNAYSDLIFTGERWFIVGAFDLAFGGNDRPCIRFAKVGTIPGNKWGIQLFPPIIVPINVNSRNPVDYQLVEYAQKLCEKFSVKGKEYSCPPENFALDATGRGGAVLSIAQRTWNRHVIGVDFGGAASEDAVNLEDPRPANEVYRNKRAEMWFRLRNAVDHEQVKGFDPDTVTELVNMEFEDIATDGRSKLIVLMSKKDYKEKYRKSPDYGDVTAIVLEVARMKGFSLSPLGETIAKAEDWSQLVNKTQSVYENTYREEELVEEEFEEATV